MSIGVHFDWHFPRHLLLAVSCSEISASGSWVMSALIGRLITLDFDDVALKEIRILKRRLEASVSSSVRQRGSKTNLPVATCREEMHSSQRLRLWLICSILVTRMSRALGEHSFCHWLGWRLGSLGWAAKAKFPPLPPSSAVTAVTTP